MIRDPTDSGYILTKEVTDYIKNYIKSKSKINVLDLLDSPQLVGYTYPNYHYTSTSSLYPTKEKDTYEIRELSSFPNSRFK